MRNFDLLKTSVCLKACLLSTLIFSSRCLADAAEGDNRLVEPIKEIEVELEEVDGIFNDNALIFFKPVVQFSCARALTRVEDALEADLRGEQEDKKIAALKALCSNFAPSSVPLQHQAFLALKDKHPEDESITLAKHAFSAERIIAVIAQMPPNGINDKEKREYYWCIRAAGVLKLEQCIPRLKELSAVDDLYTNLAAERSIEDFIGEKAEEALIHVVSCWRYNAYVHAANEMQKRNPKKFSLALEKMNPPEKDKYQYGLFLARCQNPKAVPILCETVKNINIRDHEMFSHIAALGRPIDKKLIEALPDAVRPEQREEALDCLAKYLKRMAESAY